MPRYDHVRCELLGEIGEYPGLMLPLASGKRRRVRLMVALDLVRYRSAARGQDATASLASPR